MHGNVSEWCADWFDNRYYVGSPTDDPQGPNLGPQLAGIGDHVLRGGAWNNSQPAYLRCASRITISSKDNSNNGFRVARTIP